MHILARILPSPTIKPFPDRERGVLLHKISVFKSVSTPIYLRFFICQCNLPCLMERAVLEPVRPS